MPEGNRQQPTASVALLEKRSEILGTVRSFFQKRGLIEVQTPTLASSTVTDPMIASIEVEGHGYLQTSPEFHIKQLLAAGLGSCYQLGPCYRESEIGRWHQPEFTMLEWYRVDWDLPRLMQEVRELVDLLLGPNEYQFRTCRELFDEAYQVDLFQLEPEDFAKLAEERGLERPFDVLDAFDFLLDRAIRVLSYPRLQVSQYPGYRAALAKTEFEGDFEVALRSELIVNGLELANAYDELQDADELERRMRVDNEHREMWGYPQMRPCQNLLGAMRQGLPQCAGVALGFDRLVALACGLDGIAETIAFAKPVA